MVGDKSQFQDLESKKILERVNVYDSYIYMYILYEYVWVCTSRVSPEPGFGLCLLFQGVSGESHLNAHRVDQVRLPRCFPH